MLFWPCGVLSTHMSVELVSALTRRPPSASHAAVPMPGGGVRACCTGEEPQTRPDRSAYARVSAAVGFRAMCSSRVALAGAAANQEPKYATGSLRPRMAV